MTARQPNERLLIVLVLIVLVLAFGAAGRGDYEDAVVAENAALKRRLAACDTPPGGYPTDHFPAPGNMLRTAEAR